ncbi:MAG: aspartate 1-decarboxylase [Anaerococcus vaginalis]|uniref:aspartate 1-decarboxylase n=1 Tax=Anaerococcus vaginalis TaxID=33037 RepID=UPI00290B985D|nr:aspartate 1-decarboxylase [Anaerococcus vaginalis]MDU6181685.1 aspartate 1-decarboxylase [Anaerococcus vaginalis]MDU7433189.1 aspartate 1-decarboxylase [Anaerococcus vaginalis]
MEIEMLKGKIHRATVTQAELDYVGSITVDEALLNAAGIREYQKVQVVNINNGNRIETYTIAGEKDSGVICLNGAAARHFSPNDLVIIMAYASYSEKDLENYSPKVVFVDDKNKIKKISSYEKHGRLS